MRSRRAYLATFAAATLAGCVGDSPRSTADSDPPTGTTTTPSTSSRPAVTIEAAAVQYAYRHIENVDWHAIETADGQFVFVTVDATEATQAPSREAFTLVADDKRYDPIEVRNTLPVDIDVPGEAYTPEQEHSGPRGWLVFDVPAQLETQPSLRVAGETDSWEWALSTEKATAPPPVWEWTASAPDTVQPDETFDITVSAENVGDGPGTFRGAVNFSYPMYRPKDFDIELDPGESDEAAISASTTNAEPGTELVYGIRTPAGQSEVTVTVGSESTATESTN